MSTEVTPITHTEQVIAGQVEPITHLEKVIAAYGGGGGGGGFTPTQDQLDAMHSGINAERVGELEGIDDTGDNYIEVNGIRLYIASTAPTGDIPDGSIGVGW